MNKEFFKLGIIGNPLKHSISPLIQMAALKSAGFDGSYEKFEVEKENLLEQIKYFTDNGFSGFNITIPHKVEIISYLDEIDEGAKKIGAVNTVKICDNGLLKGYNTDIYGFINSIPDDFKNINNAIILGCGGAALAVVFGLENLGCKNITIAARKLEKASAFVDSLKNKTNINFNIKMLNEILSLENADILVNATPLGMFGENENQMPLPEEAFKSLSNAFIFDLVYNPEETLLLQTAKKYDYHYTNGLNMLLLQGAKAFEIWTGHYPAIEHMKSAYCN